MGCVASKIAGRSVSSRVSTVRKDRVRGAARLEAVGSAANESVVRHAPVVGS